MTLLQMKAVICHQLEIDANASLNSIVQDASKLFGIEDSEQGKKPLLQRIKRIMALLGVNKCEEGVHIFDATIPAPVDTDNIESVRVLNMGLLKQETSLLSEDHVLELFTTSLSYQLLKPSENGFLPTGLVICVLLVLFVLAKDNKDTVRRLGLALCLNVDDAGFEETIQQMLHWVPDILRPFDEYIFFSVGIEPVLTNMKLSMFSSSFQDWDSVNRAVERVCGYTPMLKKPDGIVFGIGAFMERLFVTEGFQENIKWSASAHKAFVGAHVKGSFRFFKNDNRKGAVILPLISPPGQNDYVVLVDASVMQRHGMSDILRRLKASPLMDIVVRYPVARLGIDARVDDHLGISGIRVDSVSSVLSEMRVCADMLLTPHGLMMRAMVKVSLTRGMRPPEIVFDGPFFVFLYTSGCGNQEICSGIGYVATAESFMDI